MRESEFWVNITLYKHLPGYSFIYIFLNHGTPICQFSKYRIIIGYGKIHCLKDHGISQGKPVTSAAKSKLDWKQDTEKASRDTTNAIVQAGTLTVAFHSVRSASVQRA